jgi:hypothetical protein
LTDELNEKVTGKIMAIRFNIKKYEQIKAEYIKFLESGNVNAISQSNFITYKSYLDSDEEVKAVLNYVRSKKMIEQITTHLKQEKTEIQTHIPKLTLDSQKTFLKYQMHIESNLVNMTIKGCRSLIKCIRKETNLKRKEKQLLIDKIYVEIDVKKESEKRKRKFRKQKYNEPKIFISSIYCDTYGSKAINNFRRK